MSLISVVSFFFILCYIFCFCEEIVNLHHCQTGMMYVLAGDEISEQFLPSPWPTVSMPIVNMHQPPPPPPLPEDPEEELPPLPLDPSPGGSSAVLSEFCVDSGTSEPQSGE